MKNILIDMKVNEKALSKLEYMKNVNVEVIEPSENKRQIEKNLLVDKHILFCTLPPQNFDDMKSLEFIQIGSAGYSQLYNLGLVKKGIKASNAKGVFEIPISEWVISMMVNSARDLRGMIRNQEKGIWDRSARFQREIRG